MSQYKAIAATSYAADHVSGLTEAKFDKPTPTGRHLLVRNISAAVNPVDFKKLSNFGNHEAKLEQPLVAGYDAAGVVEAVGPEAKLFRAGDAVYYAGTLAKPGSFAEYTVVDERIVGRKPNNLNWNEAATVPLVALTAWEGFVEQLGIPVPTNEEERQRNHSKAVLIIAGAGGVGSIAIQIAKRVLNLQVVASASRENTIKYCKELGADHVVNHQQPFGPQIKALGLSGVDYVLNTIDPAQNFKQAAEALNVFGKMCCIVGPSGPVDIGSIFARRGTVTFEFMFSRPLLDADPEKQHEILNRVAALLESGVLRHCLQQTFPFTLEGVRDALRLQVSGTTIGKTAISISNA